MPSALCDVGVVTWVVWQVAMDSEAGWWRPLRPWHGLWLAQVGHTGGRRCVQSAVDTVWCGCGDLGGVSGVERQRCRVVQASHEALTRCAIENHEVL